MKNKHLMIVALLIGLVFLLAACAGPIGPAGPAGPAGPVGDPGAAGPAGPAGADAVMPVTAAIIEPETCGICHKNAADNHQESYDELYQDGVIQVSNMTYAFAGNKTTITFMLTKSGAPFSAANIDSIAIYFVPYTGTAFQFEPAGERLSLKGNITCDATGKCTSVLESEAPDVRNTPGLIVLYGRDEQVAVLPARVSQSKFPFAAILETGSGVDYVSAANNDGCKKCHTDPYLKHGYIYAQVNGDPATDFYTCKACHLDNGEGGHFEWQLLVDDPVAAAAFFADEATLTPEMAEKYAYKTTLMNDVHMSHAMEFPYPQSMANCVTCHEGKLDMVLSDANFNVETCKSCHPMTGASAMDEAGENTIYDTTTLALSTILPPAIHGGMDLATADCVSCHGVGEGKSAKPFSLIHTGYNEAIFTADGLKYSDAISVTIDSASFEGAKLAVQFSAHQNVEIEGVDATTITPTVMVSLYGWDTKDFIIGAHERLIDDNGDGAFDSKDSRNLEAAAGEEHPRMATVAAEGGKWEVSFDLSTWADMIADGSVRRVEIGVMPELVNGDGVMLALVAPSRTFDLGANAFADDFYSPIAKVTDGCNNCHEALGTTFHSPDRGGNIVVCRMCHITKAGGSHLELQSRSIDSYIHAIHSFQAFDVGDIDFGDPVQALEYEHHIEFPYPAHGVTNCLSCHVEGTNNVPDQSKSLPGLLSASDTLTGREADIKDIPVMVTGPASRACGGCHRAVLIKEDNANELTIYSQHIKNGGYLIEGGENPGATLADVIAQMMALFK